MPRVMASKKVSVSRTVARAASKRAIRRIRLAIATVSLIRAATLGGRCSSSARAEEGIATATPIFCQAAFRPNKHMRCGRGAHAQLRVGFACFGVLWSRRRWLGFRRRRRRLGPNARPRLHGRDPAAASAVGPGACAVGPAQEAAVAPRKKLPSPPHKSDAKANKKITLCNNFAQLSLQSQQRCAQTRTSSPERQ